jgi:hypothetical protein
MEPLHFTEKAKFESLGLFPEINQIPTSLYTLTNPGLMLHLTAIACLK